MDRSDYFFIIKKSSRDFGIDENLIEALIYVESCFNPWATRYEPDYSYLFMAREYASKLFLSIDTEIMHQKTSWGLMQIMGGKCREMGFSDHLTRLTSPDLNLFYGCTLLKKLFERYPTEPEVVSAYNAGSAKKTDGGMFINQRYVDKVYSELNRLRKLK